MTWYQFNAFLLVLVVNPETRKYIIGMGVFPKRLFCFYQRKDENDTPDGFDF